jgi:ADP-ribose pyrophosphatase YjhB (NUDIX family)
VAGTRIIDRLHRAAIAGVYALPPTLRMVVVRAATPLYTVGAMCVIEDGAGRILLVRQPYRPGWGLPGGFLKRRETPEACAVREVMEEVGLEVELIGPRQVVVDAQRRGVETLFRAQAVRPGDLEHVRPRSPELVETGWFDRSALPELQMEAARALAVI